MTASTSTNPASPVNSTPGDPIDTFRGHTRTTPGRLQVAQIAIALAALMLWATFQATLSDGEATIRTIGTDSVPSIIAAQQIRSNLADMNASAANALLGTPVEARTALAEYERDRANTSDELVTAAKNITYDVAERTPIVTMVDALQIYHARVEVARTQAPQERVLTFQKASDQLHQVLLKAAGDLDKANFTALDNAVNESRGRNGFILARLAIVAG